MHGISKSYPGVQALSGVDLELRSGEVLALVGENGAGKSTLIKILAGAQRADGGAIYLDGHPVYLTTPQAARRAGLAVIYQEFNLVPTLTAADNIFLGREGGLHGFIRHRQEQNQAAALFRRFGVTIPTEALCRELTVAQQQIVEIAKALSVDARILVMDEPSATLSPTEVAGLFAVIRELKAQGLGLIYVSHRLEEVFAIADRVVVLRDGQCVATRDIGQVNRQQLIEMMVGRQMEQEFPQRQIRLGDPYLVVRNLCRGRKVRQVSFAIRRGEVLGLTGLVGAGRTETARLLFGADQAESGTIELGGRILSLRNPRDAIRAGIALLTEDRKAQGLVLGLSVRENFGLPNLAKFSRGNFVDQSSESRALQRFVASLRLRLAYPDQSVRGLSGGNQQKVVLAKWLERQCEVLVFDEPTRGIDVGAKYEVYLLINELAAQGKAILLISSEFPEIVGMSDRILVMREGQVAGEILNSPPTNPESILQLAVGAQEAAFD
jgi:ribose transport system ATP-binding protein